MSLNDVVKKVLILRGQKNELERSLKETQLEIRKRKDELRYTERAHEIIREVGLVTQKQLQYHIADIVSVALQGVFDEPYKLVLNFEERRGKTECEILFERKGNLINPIDEAGGGVADIAAFALRIASWAMQTPRTRNTIVLDEPFKHLQKNLHSRASEMIKQLSQQLGIQFIIITHEQDLGLYADKVFTVTQFNGVSKVEEK